MDDSIPQPRRNIRLIVAYDGWAYHGWQRQADGIDTVQERIERAASRVVRHPVTIHGAGRTDAGVHAEGQCANFYTNRLEIPLEGMRKAIVSRLPADISILSAQEVDEQFHASRSAIGKTYRYRIYVSASRPVALARQVYHYWRPLDALRMAQAARRLVGTHDFRGLAQSAEERENTVRTIWRCDVSEQGNEIHVTVQGNGFLYNMVRNIVGTLIEIGRGHWDSDRIDLILSSLDRRNAGPTAPPQGLSLVCVHY
jgi:tRNA pseudouridine38-40 synthase